MSTCTDNMKFDMLINPNKINMEEDSNNKKIETEVQNILETTSVISDENEESEIEIETEFKEQFEEEKDNDQSDNDNTNNSEESIVIKEKEDVYIPIPAPTPVNNPRYQNNYNDNNVSVLDQKIKKIEYLRIFTEYKKKGFELSHVFDMNSDINEMEAELNLLKSQRSKQQALKLSQGFLINAVQTFEFLNSKYDPLGMDLVGFSEVVSCGVSQGSYDDVLDELYEKYKHVGRKVEPEIKLVLMLGASAATYHTSKRLVGKVAGSEEPLNRNPSFINNVNKVGTSFVNSMEKKNEVTNESPSPTMNIKDEKSKRRDLFNKVKL